MQLLAKNDIFFAAKSSNKNHHVKVWWKFDESFTETFNGHMKVSLKLSLKLSGDKWKFHETFTTYMKLSWKFHYMPETFMKLSLHAWNFHESFTCGLKVSVKLTLNLSCGHWKFQWKFHQTFSKLSHASFFQSKKQVIFIKKTCCGFKKYQKQSDEWLNFEENESFFPTCSQEISVDDCSESKIVGEPLLPTFFFKVYFQKKWFGEMQLEVSSTLYFMKNRF